MTEADIRTLCSALEQVLRPHLQASPALRDVAGVFGRWLVDQAAAASADAQGAHRPLTGGHFAAPAEPARSVSANQWPTEPDSRGPTIPRVSLAVPPAVPRGAAYVPLKIGDSSIQVPVAGTTVEIGRARQAAMEQARASETGVAAWAEACREIDLAMVAQRCGLKASSCRVVIERRAGAGDPIRDEAVGNQIRALLEQARALPDCFLWSLFPDAEQPSDEALAQCAACYDALGSGATLARLVNTHLEASADDLAGAVQLLAEASSALRVALQETWLTRDDMDQLAAHQWLKQITWTKRVYVERHMRLDDPADPSLASDLMQRMTALREGIDGRARQGAEVRSALKQVQYHTRLIPQKPATEAVWDWRRLADGVTRLRALGVPESDVRLTGVLVAVAAMDVPVDIKSPGLHEALEWARAAIKRAADVNGDDEESGSDASPRAPSERVLQVRSLLSGRTVVIVGGEPRPDAQQRLKQAFDLADVEWVHLVEHGSALPMRAPIQRPETALVLVLVKLAGHQHVDEAKSYARAAGKPCVLMTAGYNPERVAAEVLTQASTGLRRTSLV